MNAWEDGTAEMLAFVVTVVAIVVLALGVDRGVVAVSDTGGQVTVTIAYPQGLGLVLCQLDRNTAAQVVLRAAKAGRATTVVYEEEEAA